VCCLHGRQRMEHLWSRAGATGGNRSQMGGASKRVEQAKTVAVGCDRLPIGAHGKEGVDGSSPSEGFSEFPANRTFGLSVEQTPCHARALAGNARCSHGVRTGSWIRLVRAVPTDLSQGCDRRGSTVRTSVGFAEAAAMRAL
jgi:hypothetical protein